MNDFEPDDQFEKTSKRGRPKRAKEEKQRRRRRTEGSYEGRIRLGVNEDLLDRENFAYRWINDTSGRLDAMTKKDDWDIVTDPNIKDDSNAEGAPVRQLVGTKEDGDGLYAYLCRKPIEFHREDRRRKFARGDEMEQQIMQGQHKDGASTSDPNVYVPSSGISMSSTGEGGKTYKP